MLHAAPVLGIHPGRQGRVDPWPSVTVLVDATEAEAVARALAAGPLEIFVASGQDLEAARRQREGGVP